LEALLLAALGAALGMLIAFGGVRLMLALWGGSIPRADGVAVNGVALAFASFAALAIAVLVGLVPMLVVDVGSQAGRLRAGGRGSVSRGDRLQAGLVVVEVALGFVLVVAAGLLVNTAIRLGRVDLGIESRGAVSFRITLPSARYSTPEQAAAFFATLVRELEALPAVTAAGLATRDPLSGGTNGDFTTSNDVARAQLLEMRGVNPAWFAATGQRLIGGRTLEERDALPGATAIVVNATLARELFPDGDALGREIRATWREGAWTIVGIVSDVRDFGPTETPRATLYFPFGGDVMTSSSMSVLVRTVGDDAAAVLPAIRERIRALDPDLPLTSVATLETLAARTLGRERRASLALIGAFAALSLLLALLGLYAVIAFVVEERRREVGVRMALGATRNGILRMVCARGLRLAGLGIVLGFLGTLIAGRLITHLLWNVRPVDPLTLSATALLFAIVALAGSALPARRAASFDVTDVLRHE
jgi:putative ABC transport system permease protein